MSRRLRGEFNNMLRLEGRVAPDGLPFQPGDTHPGYEIPRFAAIGPDLLRNKTKPWSGSLRDSAKRSEFPNNGNPSWKRKPMATIIERESAAGKTASL